MERKMLELVSRVLKNKYGVSQEEYSDNAYACVTKDGILRTAVLKDNEITLISEMEITKYEKERMRFADWLYENAYYL